VKYSIPQQYYTFTFYHKFKWTSNVGGDIIYFADDNAILYSGDYINSLESLDHIRQ